LVRSRDLKSTAAARRCTLDALCKRALSLRDRSSSECDRQSIDERDRIAADTRRDRDELDARGGRSPE
jgi:hypothetical protein